jgi:hypothetical protein
MIMIAKAMPWAVAMILIAIGKDYGLVAPATAETMFAILPVLAVVTTHGCINCFASIRRRSEGAQR